MRTIKCPRCIQGQMFLDFDNELQWECLQCGHIMLSHINVENPRRYETGAPYTASPSECTLRIFNTIPSFIHGEQVTQYRHGNR